MLGIPFFCINAINREEVEMPFVELARIVAVHKEQKNDLRRKHVVYCGVPEAKQVGGSPCCHDIVRQLVYEAWPLAEIDVDKDTQELWQQEIIDKVTNCHSFGWCCCLVLCPSGYLVCLQSVLPSLQLFQVVSCL